MTSGTHDGRGAAARKWLGPLSTAVLGVLWAACAGRPASVTGTVPQPVTPNDGLTWPGGQPADPACTVGLLDAGGSGGVAALRPDPNERVASIRVVVDGQVDLTNAPVPRTRAERFVFSQIYGTLVTVDCLGQVVPALATAWRVSADGREWMFTLSPEAEYSDGTRVSAESIARDWLERRNQVAGPAGASSGSVVASVPMYGLSAISQVAALDVRMLRVRTEFPLPLEAFAASEFAVSRRVPGRTWPLGTNAYEVSEDPLRLIAHDGAATPAGGGRFAGAGPGRGPLEIIIVPTGDPRDAADDPATDVLITGDARAIDYLARLPAFTSKPLAWDRQYVFAWVPGGARAAGAVAEDSLPGAPSPSQNVLTQMIGALPLDALRTQLANDVVRGGARAAGASAEMVACQVAAPATPAPRPDTVYYAATDPIARGIAERIVALARGVRGGAVTPVAAPVGTDVVTGMFGTGHSRRVAMVVGLAIPRSSCGPGVPLVDARPLLSVRAGLRDVLIDGSGRVWLGAPVFQRPARGRE